MGRGNVSAKFQTFRSTGSSEAFSKGYDGIDWGDSPPVSETHHKGWAGYRLKRVEKDYREAPRGTQVTST